MRLGKKEETTLRFNYLYIHTHTHTHTHVCVYYVYMYCEYESLSNADRNVLHIIGKVRVPQRWLATARLLVFTFFSFIVTSYDSSLLLLLLLPTQLRFLATSTYLKWVFRLYTYLPFIDLFGVIGSLALFARAQWPPRAETTAHINLHLLVSWI